MGTLPDQLFVYCSSPLLITVRVALLFTLLGFIQTAVGAGESLRLEIDCGELRRDAEVALQFAEQGKWELHDVVLPWRAELDGDARPQRIRVRAAGCWSPVDEWEVSENPEIRLRPTGFVAGQWKLPETRSAEPPDTLTAAFVAADESMDATLDPFGARCESNRVAWKCEIPAGTWNLRFDSPGTAPSYRPDVGVDEGHVATVPALEMTPASSLRGWVRSPSRWDQIRVLARRIGRGLERDPAAQERLSRLSTWEVVADDRGHFDFTGLPPGRFQVLAEAGQLQSATEDVSIRTAGRDVSLEAPLDLTTLASIHLTLEPPVDPWGDPWKIELFAPTEDPGVEKGVLTETAKHDGTWQSRGIAPGRYRVQVSDSQGGPWASRDVSLWDGIPEDLFVPLDVVPVRGRARMGDEALATSIYFGLGSPYIEMESDEEGRFRGHLPREGRWRVQIGEGRRKVTLDEVQVVRRDGSSWADLELRIPGTRVSGEVTKEGEPARAAIVALRGTLDPRGASGDQHAALRREAALVTEDGRFELLGVAPGTLHFRASSGEWESDWITARVAEDAPLELHLELLRARTIRGHVSVAGLPASGVRIHYQQKDALAKVALSGMDGAVDLQLFGTPASLDIIVSPPHGGLDFRRWAIPLGGTPASLNVSPESGHLVLLHADPSHFLSRDGVSFPLRVVLSMLGDGRARYDATGRLLLENLAIGRWTLCTRPTSRTDTDSRISHCSSADVLPNQTVTLAPMEE